MSWDFLLLLGFCLIFDPFKSCVFILRYNVYSQSVKKKSANRKGHIYICFSYRVLRFSKFTVHVSYNWRTAKLVIGYFFSRILYDLVQNEIPLSWEFYTNGCFRHWLHEIRFISSSPNCYIADFVHLKWIELQYFPSSRFFIIFEFLTVMYQYQWDHISKYYYTETSYSKLYF